MSGGVSGHNALKINGWILSSDVGCAFMCVDGLAHYYAQTKEKYIKKNFKGLSESERRKMVRTFESDLQTALAVEYAKQNPKKVIESAKVETPKPKKKTVEKTEMNK